MSLEAVLDEVLAFVTRFVRFPDEANQPIAVTLWLAHTYAIDAAEYTPYLQITGPEKRCGKSRLLEVIEALCREPISTANISPSALFRVIEEKTPTVLLDEYDTVFGGRHNADTAQDLRAILNAGHRRGGKVHRSVPQGRGFKLAAFEVFAPKALAGIGDLPDTIADRSILIGLQRQSPHERAERFRRKQRHFAEPIGIRLAEWMETLIEDLNHARPQVPEELDDRAADGWEPLLAIADAAGGDWPSKARAAAVVLSGDEDAAAMSLGQLLLADIKSVFDDLAVTYLDTEDGPALWTSDLLAGLARIEESPWGEWDLKPRRPRKE